MVIPNILLVGLTSAGLIEILCLFTKMLYNWQIQRQWIPQCYRNVVLTADFAMDKIRRISPSVHFCILEDPDQDKIQVFSRKKNCVIEQVTNSLHKEITITKTHLR